MSNRPKPTLTPVQREEARLKAEAQKRKEAKDAANAFALRQQAGKPTASQTLTRAAAAVVPVPPEFDVVRKALHDEKHATATQK